MQADALIGTVTLSAALGLIPAGAFAFRVRGGLFDLGSTTVGRLVWSTTMSLMMALATLNWRTAALLPALFVGCVLPWWGSIDMGRNEGSRAVDALLQTVRGVLWVLPAAGVMVWAGGWLDGALVLLPGLLCAPAYELGWRTPSTIAGFNRGAELGEVYFGAAIGAGLCAAAIF